VIFATNGRVANRREHIRQVIDTVFGAQSTSRDLIDWRSTRDPARIALYGSFGWKGEAIVRGRVLEDEGVPAPSPEQSRLTNLLSLLKRLEADPIPHASVELTIGSASQELTADDEGFFEGKMRLEEPVARDGQWIKLDAQLVARDGEPRTSTSTADMKATGRVLVPETPPPFLVISDMDDTVLQSKVTSFLLAVRTLLLENARTRLPFPGVAAFYRALQAGPSGSSRNPIFYVSSSPWNLHEVITDFLDAQGIPAGPVMLRNVDLSLQTLSAHRHHVHKDAMIRQVLTMYPNVPVVLIGDSSQQDPEIYRKVVQEYPERINAIYIRNVTRNPERDEAIQRLAKEVLDAGSRMILADDTLAIARDAAEHGLIDSARLEEIGHDKRADEGVADEKKEAPGTRDVTDAPVPTVVVEDSPGGQGQRIDAR
jgi:phosphatidate phosphatase APP1